MIYASPHPAVEIAEASLHDQILLAMDARGRAAALVDDASGRTLSGHEVASAIRGVAAGLQQRGHRPGDVVCIAAPASPEWLIVALATLATGATVATANPLVPAAMLTAQLESCAARTLVTVPALLDRAQAATEGLDIELVILGAAAEAGAHRTLHDLTTTGAQPAAVPVDPAATAFLLHSSGTSGLPKRAMIPHRACLATGQLVRGATGRFEPDDCTLMALPLFHAGGLTVSLASMLHGVKLVLQPRFELPRFLGAIAGHRVTFTVVVPPIVQALARHSLVDGYDLSSLRLVLSTAAPLSAALEAELGARLGCAVGQGYAMTEGVPFTISRSDAPGYRPGSVGPAAPGTELRLVDPVTGADAPPGGPGELWVRGPQLMAGYAGDPEATAAALTTDGWLRSGDMCSIDADGNLTVHDRLKELIKVSGMQVPPAELEGILLSHPDVQDCAVVPRPHAKTGEVPVAYVVAAPQLDVASVSAYVAERVPPYKRLGRHRGGRRDPQDPDRQAPPPAADRTRTPPGRPTRVSADPTGRTECPALPLRRPSRRSAGTAGCGPRPCGHGRRRPRRRRR